MGAGVATLDAALLGAEPIVVDEMLRETVDGPTLLRIEGSWPDPISESARHALARVAAVTVAVGAPGASADAFDLIIDNNGFDALAAAFQRAPLAAVAGALLLRSAPRPILDGLVAESATYSTLQAGPEFRAWRTARPARSVPDAEAPRVLVHHHPEVCEIVLVRAGRHNALDVRMRDALHSALVEAARTDRPVVLRADGPSFCSGGDLDEFGSFPDPAQAHLIRLDRSLALAVDAIADRLVVALHGSCLGAGIELPAFAGQVIAADDARFGLPEQALGLVPGAGGTVSLPGRIGRHATLAMLLQEGTTNAMQANAIGLVDEVVPVVELRGRALAIAATLT